MHPSGKKEFEGKTAIVTGSAKGIGKEIALVFGKEGANVVICDLDKDECAAVAKQISDSGGKAIAAKCDVSIKKDVDSLFKKALNEFGKIDVLINNAGIYPFVPLQQMTDEQWKKVIDVNLKGTFLCSKAAAAEMIKQGKGGKIVNISSIASIRGYPALAHYCASKGGINGFTRALAVELAQYKINVNAIAPGIVRTPGIEAVDKKTIAGIASTIPLGRIGEPADIANAALFLSSDKADFITGQVLVVDGGTTAK